jgi:hypothetical protein
VALTGQSPPALVLRKPARRRGNVRESLVTVRRQTELDASVERVWQAMLQPSTMLYVLKGIFSFPALNGRIDPIREGESGTGWTLLFHTLPFARWTIKVVRVDDSAHTIVTHEHGGIVRRWNHTLHVQELDAARSRYHDTVEVDAGPLTRPVAAFVGFIFSYRQHRLRRLAHRHLASSR